MQLWWVTEWDLMAGCDLHDEVTATPPPVQVPKTPHLVSAAMHWATNGHELEKRTVIIEGRKSCKHMHDVAMLIPHLPIPPWPPCVLALPITACSKSKIMLGAFTVIANGEPAGLYGPQINCNQPWHLPTGLNIPTRLPTVWCGFGLKDLFCSMVMAACDVIVARFIDKILEKIAPLEELEGLAHYWKHAAISALFAKLTFRNAMRIAGQELLGLAARRGMELLAEKTHYEKKLSEYLEHTVGHWNPHATPERVAAAAEQSVQMFADIIYERVVADRGILSAIQGPIIGLVGEDKAGRVLNETKSEITREEWHSGYEKGFGKETRAVVSQALWDYCAKLSDG